jgi:hypothetical protein
VGLLGISNVAEHPYVPCAITASHEALEAAEVAETSWIIGAVRNYLAQAYLATGAPNSAARTVLSQLGAIRDGASSQGLANTLRVASGLLQQAGGSGAADLIRQWLESQHASMPGSPELAQLAGNPDSIDQWSTNDIGNWGPDRITGWVHQQVSSAHGPRSSSSARRHRVGSIGSRSQTGRPASEMPLEHDEPPT